MKFEFSTLRVPENEEEVDAFDWKAFPPAIALRSECHTPLGSAVEPDV